MIITSLGLFLIQSYYEDILLVGKTFLCLDIFHLSENSYVRKMFNLPQLLVSKIKSQYLVY